ncbi:MAG: DNA polymerase II large subunit [Nanoarchaeota archaeon]|nr:DNA polymerase II large subunit [Nanoarchaeota archaeon]
MTPNQYFKLIEEKVHEDYELAKKAKAKGVDPVAEVEIPIASSLAEKVVGLISTVYPQIADKRIVSRILELEKKFGSLDPCVALSIAEEVAKEKYVKFKDHKEAIEAGIRVAIAYMTLGVVSSPIEGFVELKFEKTKNGEDYFVPYYSGPIRSAGGTEAAFSLVVIDHLREIFGYAKYDPNEEEIKRGVHESYEYHERVTNLQYLPTEKEIEFLMSYLPIQVSGDASESREVYNYKDLSRVPTNFIRSGFCLTLNEGLAQKAPKILKRVKRLRENGFKLSDWDFLEKFVELQGELKKKKTADVSGGAVYIKDLVAGRPVFGHPSRSGGFRLRYGRCRNTGYSCLAVHPATMRICGDFIAVGTQLKIESPTKGCVAASCTTIDGPIVKFKNGAVKKITDCDEAKRVYDDVEEIIYLGDLLVPYGDFRNRNHALEKQGYIEQYWLQEVKKAGGASELFVDFKEAVKISEKLNVSLHPSFIFYWTQIGKDDFLALFDWIGHGELSGEKFVLPWTKADKERFARGKRALELIGCEHEVSLENVVLNEKNKNALLFNLGFGVLKLDRNCFGNEFDKLLQKVGDFEGSVLSKINELCDLEVRDKAGVFVGSRMGRPEKAKLRKLTGSPHVLFPVGNEGGRLRSFQAALDVGTVKAEFPDFYCSKCEKGTVYPRCGVCGEYCKRLESEKYKERRIDIRSYFDEAKKIAGVSVDEIPIVKGVRGTSNKDHSTEFLAKGLLRAKYNLHVNKDGTIRYDMIEMPLTHFKAKEIGTSVEKLRELGYEKDINGKKLESENQVLELFPHDIVLPACSESSDEKADDVFLKITKFVDEELEKIYGLEKKFNAKGREDLIGVLLGCMAPHNCASVIGRLIGFSKTQGMLASPYMHAAMRRDCDGDEAACMLFMDMLLNFSRKFLPAHRGGTQDAPLVVNARIRAGEVDDIIFDVDVSKEIPLELYEAAEERKSPYDVKMEQVKDRLGGDKEFVDLGYSYETEDINLGPLCSSYKILPTMQEKVNAQMELCKKIRAVDTADVARLIIERHFIRDTRGNLRKFSMQGFRCVGCNAKYRRPPLVGKCTKCGGKLIFTISEGSIVKYMQPALDLAREFGASRYLLESLELTEMYIQSIFGREKEKQEALGKWF